MHDECAACPFTAASFLHLDPVGAWGDQVVQYPLTVVGSVTW